MDAEIVKLVNRIIALGGKPYLVGGYVRDLAMGIEPSADYDIEVFGLSVETLESLLGVGQKGESFGVFKVGNADFSVPRTEVKTGPEHTDFEVRPDPFLGLVEAAKRRDFTINAMYMDFEGNLLDPHGGLADLKAKVLRPTSEQFADDALRVLRGMQFASRFEMVASLEFCAVAPDLAFEYPHISKDRIREEWLKWAGGVKPSLGLKLLFDVGWLWLYPELDRLRYTEQDPKWHPEGSVWAHTLAVVDAAKDPITVLAGLTHDLGKPYVTEVKDGRIVSPGHAERPEPFEFLESIGMPHEIRDRVVESVKYHMWHYDPVTPKRVRRLLAGLKHCSVRDIYDLVVADYAGRPPLAPIVPENAEIMLALSAELADEVKPIFMGRHLIEMGFKPGKHFGEILNAAYEAQLDGDFSDLEGAWAWFERYST